MPRTRSIKPGFFDNEELGEADPMVSLLFIGLWTLADREGRLEDRPRRIRKQLFGFRDCVNVDGLLDELWRMGFLVRYEVDGARLIQIKNFGRHQSPHPKETASTLEGPSDAGAVARSDQAVERPDPAPENPERAHLVTGCCELVTGNGLLVSGPDASAQAREMTDGDIERPSQYLDRLRNRHGYGPRCSPLDNRALQQAVRWQNERVTAAELDHAVTVSRDTLAADGDTHDPPLRYLAKVIASGRKSGKAVSAGPPTETPEQAGARLQRQWFGDGANDGQALDVFAMPALEHAS